MLLKVLYCVRFIQFSMCKFIYVKHPKQVVQPISYAMCWLS